MTDDLRLRRLAAFWIDLFSSTAVQLAGGVVGGFLGVFYAGYRDFPEPVMQEFADTGIVFGYYFWTFATLILNYGVLQGLTGSTVGKLVCGLQVVREDGSRLGIFKSLARTSAYYVSGIPLALGFWRILTNKDGRGWHDLLLKTRVQRRSNVPVAQVLYLSRDKAA